MTTLELTRAIIIRLKKFSWLILIAAVGMGVLLGMYAYKSPALFTAKATVFPLNSAQESSSAASSLVTALGLGGESSKNFSDDASINIVALANSRTTREAVATKLIASMGNKTIAQLLMMSANDKKGWFEKDMKIIHDNDQLLIWASDVLKAGLFANIDRTGILNLSFTSKHPELIKIITETFIEKISQFYIDLKSEKAKRDYIFAAAKVDSLRRVMQSKDRQLVVMDKTTLFTDRTRLEFQVPTENLFKEKSLIQNQYTQAVNNRENSAYRLQKATPVIKTLDRPAPPYDMKKKSAPLYGLIGFLIGGFVFIALFVSSVIFKYVNMEAKKMINGSDVSSTSLNTNVSVSAAS